MDIFYNFCGVRFCVRADQPILEDEQAARFRVDPGAADVTVSLRPAPALPTPDGDCLGTRGEKTVYRLGGTVTRLTRDPFRSFPHLAASYALADISRVDALAREDCWRWATRSQFLWPGLALPQLLLHFRALCFHASYVACPGGALLFTAPSQTGKSTQAALWQAHRAARVLNGDKAAVRLDGAPVAHSLPFSGTSGVNENVSTPLRAVVVLSQAPQNTVRRLGAAQAVRALAPNVFADALIAEEWQSALTLLLDLVAAVPIYALACTPDERAVEALEQALAQDGISICEDRCKGGSR